MQYIDWTNEVRGIGWLRRIAVSFRWKTCALRESSQVAEWVERTHCRSTEKPTGMILAAKVMR